MLQENNRLLIGVSDGFDLTSPYWKLMLHVFAMLHEFFVEQLKSKVNRGMDDAFDRGANIGRPTTGYKLVPMTDEHGR